MMNQPIFNVKFSDLPDVLPVFPVEGAVLLPHGDLPLNVFEPRYLNMVEDALRSDRLIGMLQPNSAVPKIMGGKVPLHKTGCVGKITDFKELPDNRFIIMLHGLWRFDVAEELPMKNGYRRVRPVWRDYAGDVDTEDCLDIDREQLCTLMKKYLDRHDLVIDCAQLRQIPPTRIVTALSMICPFEAMDKQALLEAPTCESRARMLLAMLEFAAHAPNDALIH